jgi:hypothetical protein
MRLIRARRRGNPVAVSIGMTRHRKNPHAIALGRLGGLKGGRARAEKLSARRRISIARHAAAVRWHKSPVTGKPLQT